MTVKRLKPDVCGTGLERRSLVLLKWNGSESTTGLLCVWHLLWEVNSGWTVNKSFWVQSVNNLHLVTKLFNIENLPVTQHKKVVFYPKALSAVLKNFKCRFMQVKWEKTITKHKTTFFFIRNCCFCLECIMFGYFGFHL